jgi:hypothetical protein
VVCSPMSGLGLGCVITRLSGVREALPLDLTATLPF